MLSKLNVTAFKGSGGSVFRVDNFFYAVQVSHTGIRDVNVPAGDICVYESIYLCFQVPPIFTLILRLLHERT